MKYRYYLFNPRILNEETAKLANQVYQTWKAVYDGIFDALHTEDFYRNEIIACIKDLEEDKIVAFHMYSCFDERAIAHREHRYMDPFNEELVEKFKQEGARSFMSLEYLGVNNDYITSRSGIKFADVVSSLSMRSFECSPWDGLLAVARMDYKVHEKAQRLGMRPVGHIKRAQYPCQLLFLKKNETKRLEDPQVEHLVEELWNSKVNHTHLIADRFITHKHLKVA